MIKIKVSYNSDCELQEIVKLLSPVLAECKLSKNIQGRYKKAYLILVDLIK